MVESPRFQPGLVQAIDALGGIKHILLTHRDDVGDAHRWNEYYQPEVWIHEAERTAAPYATNILSDTPVSQVADGVEALFAPGHTRGHLVFYVDKRWLFTGDTLHWNHRRSELDVTPKQTFHSWEALTDTIEQLGQLSVDGVFPGHGMWCLLDSRDYASGMKNLVSAMRTHGQWGLAERPGTSFGWY